MNIKTRIYALLLSAFLLMVMVGSVVFYADKSITAGQRAIQTSAQLTRSAADLRMLGAETILFHEARAVDQWQRKIRSVDAELQALEINQPETRSAVQQIRRNIASADTIYADVKFQSESSDSVTPGKVEAESAFAVRNFSALTLVLQDVIDNASELSSASRREDAKSWRVLRIAVVLMLLFMLAQLVFMLRITRCSILQPLKTLVGATQRIAAGDYTFRLHLPQEDEIGALATAFNAMSMQVQHANKAMRLEQESLAITLNSIGDAVIATDVAGLVMRMNPVAERLTGWLLAQAVGQPLTTVFNIVSARTRLPLVNPAQTVMENGAVVGLANHTVLLARDGQEYQIADSAAPIRDATNAVVGVVLVFSDVSEMYRTQAALVRTAELLERTGALAKIGGWEMNLETRKLSWTLQTFRIAELEPSVEPTLEESINLFAPEARRTVATAIQAAIDTGTPFDLQLPIIGAKGTAGWVRLQGLVEMRDGKAVRLFGTIQDTTERKAYQTQLEHMAHFDALTNLPNRILLADRLQQAMLQSQRRQLQLAVVYLDLDGFKTINDQFGHETGDQVLITLAKRIKEALRDGDTLARIGGDEFVAVLTDLEDTSATFALINRMLTVSALPLHVGELMLQVSASLGVTFYPQTVDIESDQLLRQADQAMYQAKLAGKNRYHIFDAEQYNSLRACHESLESVRLALANGELVLHYQPKVNMRSGQVIGAEALIRWQHPARGLLAPMAFLPVVEDHSLAVDIGEWVIDTALTQIEKWRLCGLDLPVSVNVGARQLQQEDFVQRLLAILARHPEVCATSLGLEVLETSALSDMVQVSQVIEDCAQIGVTFALDDFGTGYSSLTYLKRLRVATLKIDQSFVHGMLEDPHDLAILRGVIGLAEAFKHEVIAEGVETVAHGTALMQLGCELAQGYGIAHPMAPEQMPAWVATWVPDAAWCAAPDSGETFRSTGLSVCHPTTD